ncbi:MAG: ATP-binding cassette domain-containing protein, partial [Deltaproteobacteria bacterium]|nr:ATP-binding cassette domain-containing protein [Deltaproteobacteria bacterium]
QGERQRVAICRALLNDPPFILADEPTGNLDSRTGQDIMKLLTALNQQGITVILVTHDPEIGKTAKRRIILKDGNIERDESN